MTEYRCHCGLNIDSRDTEGWCPYYCETNYCGRCGSDVERHATHVCSLENPTHRR